MNVKRAGDTKCMEFSHRNHCPVTANAAEEELLAPLGVTQKKKLLSGFHTFSTAKTWKSFFIVCIRRDGTVLDQLVFDSANDL